MSATSGISNCTYQTANEFEDCEMDNYPIIKEEEKDWETVDLKSKQNDPHIRSSKNISYHLAQ